MSIIEKVLHAGSKDVMEKQKDGDEIQGPIFSLFRDSNKLLFPNLKLLWGELEILPRTGCCSFVNYQLNDQCQLVISPRIERKEKKIEFRMRTVKTITNEFLREIPRRFPRLKGLDFLFAEFSENFSRYLVDAVEGCTDLDLVGTNITGGALQEIAKRCKTLERVNLQDCPEITEKDILDFVKNIPSLHMLIIDEIALELVKQLRQSFPKMQIWATDDPTFYL